MAAPRRFPPPWSVGETDDACFIVRDAWPATLLIKIKAQHTKKASGFHFRNSSHETASMSEADNKAIVFLLAAILCVMLFGASAVLTGFVWVAVIGVVLLVIFGVAAVIPNVLAYLARLAVAPVLEPVRCWRSIREHQAGGERVNPIVAGLEVLWTFVVSAFLWGLLIGIPLLALLFKLFPQLGK